MSDEIEFEDASSPKWPTVREGVARVASARVNRRYEAIVEGTGQFEKRAGTLVAEKIKKPPKKLPLFGFIVEQVLVIGKLVVPEAGLAAEIFELAEAAHSSLNADAELVKEANTERIEHTVEKATKALTEFAEHLGEDARKKAAAIQKNVDEHLGDALDKYINNNPRPLDEHDTFYHEFCDSLGLLDPDYDAIVRTTIESVWPQFEAKVNETADSIHFFTEMEDDVARLDYLIDMIEHGHDVEGFLADVGADKNYWDKWLAEYRAQGKESALDAISYHVGGRRTREASHGPV